MFLNNICRRSQSLFQILYMSLSRKSEEHLYLAFLLYSIAAVERDRKGRKGKGDDSKDAEKEAGFEPGLETFICLIKDVAVY